MLSAPNGISLTDDGAPFGNRLLFFILCLYAPEFILWAAFAEPGSVVLWGSWTPTILPEMAIADIAQLDRNSEWHFAVGACTMMCGLVALYWAARGMARAAPRTRIVLTICASLLLVSYSVWAWWVLLSIVATANA